MSFKLWVDSIVGVLSSVVIPLLVTLAGAFFLWGIVNYFFLNGSNEEKRLEGRSFVIWGLLGLVVIFSVWGLVSMLLSTFGLQR